jgi:hypothetical protein
MTSHSTLKVDTAAPPASADGEKNTERDLPSLPLAVWMEAGGWGCVRGISNAGTEAVGATLKPKAL